MVSNGWQREDQTAGLRAGIQEKAGSLNVDWR